MAVATVVQVGYANYRFFVLFLGYVWVGTWYLAAEAYGPFMHQHAYGLQRSNKFGNAASLVTLFFAIMVVSACDGACAGTYDGSTKLRRAVYDCRG